MALYDVFIEVAFLDAAERTARVSYLIDTQYDTVTPNFAAVLNDAADLVSGLEVLSWSEITEYKINIVVPNTDTGANIAANNQVRAFTRTVTDGGHKSSFEVPAWDDDVYDQNSQNVLSAAYDAAASSVAALLRDPATGEEMDTISYSQSRTRKSRNIIHD